VRVRGVVNWDENVSGEEICPENASCSKAAGKTLLETKRGTEYYSPSSLQKEKKRKKGQARALNRKRVTNSWTRT